MSGRALRSFFDADGSPILYWSEIPDLEEYEESLGLVPELILALDILTPKQRFVIERRYGLGGDGCCYSHRAIAEAMGVTHKAIQKLEESALMQMRGRQQQL